MSNLTERYGIVFDAAVEVSDVTLEPGADAFATLEGKLETSPAAQKLLSEAKELGQKIAAQVRAGLQQAGVFSAEALGDDVAKETREKILGQVDEIFDAVAKDHRRRTIPIDAELTDKAETAFQALKVIAQQKGHVIKIDVQGADEIARARQAINALMNMEFDGKKLDFTGLIRAAGEAGRQAARAAATMFRRNFRQLLSGMRFDVQVDAHLRNLTQSRVPVVDVDARTDAATVERVRRSVERETRRAAQRAPQPRPQPQPQPRPQPRTDRGYSGPMLAFDLETTGVDPNEARIVSYATVGVSPTGRTRRSLQDVRIVNPGVPVPDQAAGVHGITTDIARSQGIDPRVAVETVVRNIRRAHERGVPLVGHNIAYDLKVLEAEARRHNVPFPEVNDLKVIDTMTLSRRATPDVRGQGTHTLSAVTDRYGVELTQAHHAGADALGAARLVAAIRQAHPNLRIVPHSWRPANEASSAVPATLPDVRSAPVTRSVRVYGAAPSLVRDVGPVRRRRPDYLDEYTVPMLRAEARRLGLRGVSRLRKAELLAAVENYYSSPQLQAAERVRVAPVAYDQPLASAVRDAVHVASGELDLIGETEALAKIAARDAEREARNRPKLLPAYVPPTTSPAPRRSDTRAAWTANVEAARSFQGMIDPSGEYVRMMNLAGYTTEEAIGLVATRFNGDEAAAYRAMSRKLDWDGWQAYRAKYEDRQRANPGSPNDPANSLISFHRWQDITDHRRTRLITGTEVEWDGEGFDRKPKPGFVYNAENREMFPTQPFLDTLPIARVVDEQGNVTYLLDETPENVAKRVLKAEHRETIQANELPFRTLASPITAGGQRNERVQVAQYLYTPGASPVDDGGGLIDENLSFNRRERVTINLTEDQLFQPLLKKGDVLTPGEVYKLGVGDTRTYEPKRVQHRVADVVEHLWELDNGKWARRVDFILDAVGDADDFGVEDKGLTGKTMLHSAKVRDAVAYDLQGNIVEGVDIVKELRSPRSAAIEYFALQSRDEQRRLIAQYAPDAVRDDLLKRFDAGDLPATDIIPHIYERAFMDLERGEWARFRTMVEMPAEAMTRANAVALVRQHLGDEVAGLSDDEVLARGREFRHRSGRSLINRSWVTDGGAEMYEAVPLMAGLRLPGIFRPQHSYPASQHRLTYETLSDIEKVNPQLARELKRGSRGRRNAYASMMASAAHMMGAYLPDDHEVLKVTPELFDGWSAATEKHLDRYYEHHKALFPQRPSIDQTPHEVLRHAMWRAFQERVDKGDWNKNLMLALPDGREVMLPSVNAMRRLADQSRGEELEMPLDSVMNAYIGLLESAESGETLGLDESLKAYDRALTQKVTGPEFFKNATGVSVDPDRMVGKQLRIARSLQPYEFYAPKMGGKLAAVFRQPARFTEANLNVVGLTEEEARQRGLKTDQFYMSLEMAQALAGDQDGDLAYAISQGGLHQVGDDTYEVRRYFEDPDTGQRTYEVLKTLTAEQMVKNIERLGAERLAGGAGDLRAARAEIPYARDAQQAARIFEQHMADRERRLTRYSAHDLERAINERNALVGQIGSIFNVTRRQYQAGDRLGLVDNALFESLHFRAFDTAQRPAPQAPEMQKLLDVMGANAGRFYGTRRQRLNMIAAQQQTALALATLKDADGSGRYSIDLGLAAAAVTTDSDQFKNVLAAMETYRAEQTEQNKQALFRALASGRYGQPGGGGERAAAGEWASQRRIGAAALAGSIERRYREIRRQDPSYTLEQGTEDALQAMVRSRYYTAEQAAELLPEVTRYLQRRSAISDLYSKQVPGDEVGRRMAFLERLAAMQHLGVDMPLDGLLQLSGATPEGYSQPAPTPETMEAGEAARSAAERARQEADAAFDAMLGGGGDGDDGDRPFMAADGSSRCQQVMELFCAGLAKANGELATLNGLLAKINANIAGKPGGKALTEGVEGVVVGGATGSRVAVDSLRGLLDDNLASGYEQFVEIAQRRGLDERDFLRVIGQSFGDTFLRNYGLETITELVDNDSFADMVRSGDLQGAVYQARNTRSGIEQMRRFQLYLEARDAGRGDAFVFDTRDPHRNAEQRLYHERVIRHLGDEGLAQVRAGGLAGVQALVGAQDRSRLTTERIRLLQNAVSNSAAFLLSQTAFTAFGAMAQQVGEYERTYGQVRAMVNMNRRSGDAPRVMGAMQRAVGRTNLANSEIAAIIAAYDQTGDVDVRRAANLVGRMGGTLRATGEGVDAMAAFMAAAGEVQLRRPDQIARYAAARGVSMQRSAELLQIMAPALQGRSQREIARAVVGAAQVRNFTLAEGAAAHQQIDRLIRQGGSVDAFAKAELSMTRFEKTGAQLKKTLQELWEALRPAAKLLSLLAEGLLKVVETGAKVVNALGPVGDIAVTLGVLGAAFMTVRAIMKQFDAWSFFEELKEDIRASAQELAQLLKLGEVKDRVEEKVDATVGQKVRDATVGPETQQEAEAKEARREAATRRAEAEEARRRADKLWEEAEAARKLHDDELQATDGVETPDVTAARQLMEEARRAFTEADNEAIAKEAEAAKADGPTQQDRFNEFVKEEGKKAAEGAIDLLADLGMDLAGVVDNVLDAVKGGNAGDVIGAILGGVFEGGGKVIGRLADAGKKLLEDPSKIPFSQLGRGAWNAVGATGLFGLSGAGGIAGRLAAPLTLGGQIGGAASRSLLAGLLPAMGPWALGLAAAGTIGVLGFRHARRTAQARSDLRELTTGDLGQMGVSELAAAYAGDVSPALQALGYTAEDVKQKIDNMAKTGAAGARALAKEVREAAKEYERYRGVADTFTNVYQSERTRLLSHARAQGVMPIIGSPEDVRAIVSTYGNDVITTDYDEILNRVLEARRDRSLMGLAAMPERAWDTFVSVLFGGFGSREEREERIRRRNAGFFGGLFRVQTSDERWANNPMLQAYVEARNLADRADADWDQLLRGMALSDALLNPYGNIREATRRDYYRAVSQAWIEGTAPWQINAVSRLGGQAAGWVWRGWQNLTGNRGLEDQAVGMALIDARNLRVEQLEELASRQALQGALGTVYETYFNKRPGDVFNLAEAEGRLYRSNAAEYAKYVEARDQAFAEARNAQLQIMRARRDRAITASFFDGYLDVSTPRALLRSLSDPDALAFAARRAMPGSALRAAEAEYAQRMVDLQLERQNLETYFDVDGPVSVEDLLAGNLAFRTGIDRQAAEEALNNFRANVVATGQALAELDEKIRNLKVEEWFRDATRTAVASGTLNLSQYMLGRAMLPGSVNPFSSTAAQLLHDDAFANLNPQSVDSMRRFVDSRLTVQMDEHLRNAMNAAQPFRLGLQRGALNPSAAAAGLRGVVNQAMQNQAFIGQVMGFFGLTGESVDQAYIRELVIHQMGIADLLDDSAYRQAAAGVRNDQRLAQLNLGYTRQRADLLQGPATSRVLAAVRSDLEYEQAVAFANASLASRLSSLATQYATTNADGSRNIGTASVGGFEYLTATATSGDGVYQAAVAAATAEHANELERLAQEHRETASQLHIEQIERELLEDNNLVVRTADRLQNEIDRWQLEIDRLEQDPASSPLTEQGEAVVRAKLEDLSLQQERYYMVTRPRAVLETQRQVNDFVAEIAGRQVVDPARAIRQLGYSLTTNPDLLTEDLERWGALSQAVLDPATGEERYFAEGSAFAQLQAAYERLTPDLQRTVREYDLDEAAMAVATLERTGWARHVSQEDIDALEEIARQLALATMDNEIFGGNYEEALAAALKNTGLGVLIDARRNQLIAAQRGELALESANLELANLMGATFGSTQHRSRVLSMRDERNRLAEMFGEQDARVAQIDAQLASYEGIASDLDEVSGILQRAQYDAGMLQGYEAFQVRVEAVERARQILAAAEEREGIEGLVERQLGDQLVAIEQQTRAYERQGEQLLRNMRLQEQGDRILAEQTRVSRGLATMSEADVEFARLGYRRQLLDLSGQREAAIADFRYRLEDEEFSTEAMAELAGSRGILGLSTREELTEALLADETARIEQRFVDLEAQALAEYQASMATRFQQLASGGLGRYETLTSRRTAALAAFEEMSEEDRALLEPVRQRLAQVSEEQASEIDAALKTLQDELDAGGAPGIETIATLNQLAMAQDLPPEIRSMIDPVVGAALDRRQRARSVERILDRPYSRRQRLEDLEEDLADFAVTFGDLDVNLEQVQQLAADGNENAREYLQLAQQRAELEAQLAADETLVAPVRKARELIARAGERGMEAQLTEYQAQQATLQQALEDALAGTDYAGMSLDELVLESLIDPEAFDAVFKENAQGVRTLISELDGMDDATRRLVRSLRIANEEFAIRSAQEEVRRTGYSAASAAELDAANVAVLDSLRAAFASVFAEGTVITPELIERAALGDASAEMISLLADSEQGSPELATSLARRIQDAERDRAQQYAARRFYELNRENAEAFLAAEFSEETLRTLLSASQETYGQVILETANRLREGTEYADLDAVRAALENDPIIKGMLETYERGGPGVQGALQMLNFRQTQSAASARTLMAQGDYAGAVGLLTPNAQWALGLANSLLADRNLPGIDPNENLSQALVRLRAGGADDIATMLAPYLQPLIELSDANAQRQIDSIERRFAASGPLYRSAYSMLGWEQQQLQARQAFLEQGGYIDPTSANYSEAMVAVYQRNWERLNAITEEQSLYFTSQLNNLVSDTFGMFVDAVRNSISTLITELLLDTRGDAAREIDDRFERESRFNERELEYARARLAELRENMGQVMADPALRAELEYYTRYVEELEKTARSISEEWERQKNDLKTIAETIAEIFQNLFQQVLNKTIDKVLDMGINMILGGMGLPVAGVQPSSTNLPSVPSIPLTTQANAPALQSPSYRIEPLEPLGPGQSVAPVLVTQAQTQPLADAEAVNAFGIPGHLAAGINAGVTGLAGAATSGDTLGSAGLGFGSSLLSVGLSNPALLANPATLPIMAGLAAVGATVGTILFDMAKMAERRKAEYVMTTDAISDYGLERFGKSARLAGPEIKVENTVNVQSLRDFGVQRELSREIETNTRRTVAQKGYLGE